VAQGIVEMAGGALVEVCSSMAIDAEQAVGIDIYGAHGSAHYSDRT